MTQKERVYVGLSGGVDSAVSATLLQREGYEVVGAFIKIWQPEFIECTWREDRLDAMRVAAALNIEFREIDLSEQYKHEVVERMVSEYARGITPNPDVLCNERIKFGAFAQWAHTEGADRIATGHYARIQHHRDYSQLLRGIDPKKDQSYFLHRISQEELARSIFPTGIYRKEEVRSLATDAGLPVARKHDSQGLCFVGNVSMRDFLARYIPVESGEVRDEHGALIGTHDGAALYTIGARSGLTIHGAYAAHGPWYVIALDTTTNTIVASPDRSKAARTRVVVRDMHWIHEAPTLPSEVDIQVRYHDAFIPATIAYDTTELVITCTEPVIAPPGQSIVLYNGAVCLGGGYIV